MSHDADLVAKVAKAIDTRPACDHERANYGNPPHEWLNCTECDARAVLDALDVPGRERRATARFRVAAELTVQDVRAQRGDHIAGLVEDSFDAHFARAAGIDPEEGDHE